MRTLGICIYVTSTCYRLTHWLACSPENWLLLRKVLRPSGCCISTTQHGCTVWPHTARWSDYLPCQKNQIGATKACSNSIATKEVQQPKSVCALRNNKSPYSMTTYSEIVRLPPFVATKRSFNGITNHNHQIIALRVYHCDFVQPLRDKNNNFTAKFQFQLP